MVSLPGSILVIGGRFTCDDGETTEAFSLKTMTFEAGPTMLTAHRECAAFVLPQDHSPRRALVVGGGGGASYLATTEVLTTAD